MAGAEKLNQSVDIDPTILGLLNLAHCRRGERDWHEYTGATTFTPQDGGARLVEWNVEKNANRLPRRQTADGLVERRQLLFTATGGMMHSLGAGEALRRRDEYRSITDNLDGVVQSFHHPNDLGTDFPTEAHKLRGLVTQIRDKDFERQIGQINSLLAEEPQQPWVVINDSRGEREKFVAAKLRGFYLADNEYGPQPAVILEDEQGGVGLFPDARSIHNYGLFFEE